MQGEVRLGVLAGIDEAGYGPVLGPLVVSGTAFAVPDELLEGSMWTLLASGVSRKPSRGGGRVAIGDSKKLFSRRKPKALEHLERGVLGMLSVRGDAPNSFRRLLDMVTPAAVRRMTPYPWYASTDLPLPRCITATDLTLAGNSLAAAMNAAGLKLLGIRSEPLFAGEFNRHVAATNNKNRTLFDVTARLLDWIWKQAAPGLLRIYVDRHGARKHYLPALSRVFEGCTFKILRETDTTSAYRITGAGKEAEIHFCTNGEEKQLAVALGSMVSKYLRELWMEMLNSYWIDQVGELAATAGYYTDGRRFYEQIAPAVRRLGVDHRLLYRSR